MKSSKFWSKNEKETMAEIGMKATPRSGSGWISKEDGEDAEFLTQLKSTSSGRLTISKKDIDTLLYHASVAHKKPLIVLQNVELGDTWVCLRAEDFVSLRVATPTASDKRLEATPTASEKRLEAFADRKQSLLDDSGNQRYIRKRKGAETPRRNEE